MFFLFSIIVSSRSLQDSVVGPHHILVKLSGDRLATARQKPKWKDERK